MMDVVHEVIQVRHDQNKQWVHHPHVADRPPELFMDAIELKTDVAGDEADLRERFLTIAALAVAAVEAMDRKQEENAAAYFMAGVELEDS